MSDPYLSQDDVVRLRDAAVESDLADPARRSLLFAGILPKYRGSLPVLSAPGPQVQSDLNEMNRVERLIDGSVPLARWLGNAADQLTDAAARDVFLKALDRVSRDAAGEPDVAPDVPTGETKEEIVFRDDTVPFEFLGGGALAGASVARVKVLPYQGARCSSRWHCRTPAPAGSSLPACSSRTTTWSTPASAAPASSSRRTRRTCGSRRRGALPVRLRQRGRPDGRGGRGERTRGLGRGTGLRGAAAGRRTASALPPRRHAGACRAQGHAGAGQHHPAPGGEPKRIALRNNLAFDADDRDVRYFTDTRGGSSGSPVLTDDWTVVALHRGTRRVSDVSFQGKSTAFVNVGTQLSAVMEHLREHSAQVHEEIAAAQSALARQGQAQEV